MKVGLNIVSPNSSKPAACNTSPSMKAKATPRIMSAKTTALGNNTFMLVDRSNKLIEPYEWNIWQLSWALKHMNRSHLLT